MEENRNIFGNALKRARLSRGYSQQSLGELLGISRSYIQMIEKGTVEPKKTTKSIIAEWIERGSNKYDTERNTITQTMHGNGRQAGRDMITSGGGGRKVPPALRDLITYIETRGDDGLDYWEIIKGEFAVKFPEFRQWLRARR